MLNFFKKPKLKFVSLIPEVAKQMPIEPANKISFKWAKAMIDSMKESKAQTPPGTAFRHVARCPGIALVSRTGWVQRNYQDIYIKTDGSGGFSWKTPLDQSTLINDHEFKFPYVGHHSGNMTEPFGILKPHTMPTVVKIQSPWVVSVPKGYYLLCMPIPYSDDNRFTASVGLIDGDAGINFLNVQLFWHVLNGEEVIPAGTPLAHYFLIKKEKVDAEVSAVDSSTLDELRLRRLVLDSQFIQSYSKLKGL